MAWIDILNLRMLVKEVFLSDTTLQELPPYLSNHGEFHLVLYNTDAEIAPFDCPDNQPNKKNPSPLVANVTYTTTL